MKIYRKKGHAFTLIEMALILILFGVILSTTLPKLLSDIKTDKARKSKDTVVMARDELVGYVLVNRKLPSPDLTGANPAVPNVIRARSDAWGQPLTYILPNANATGGTLDNDDICAFAETELAVTTPGATTNDVVFIVSSKGLNGLDDIAGIGGTTITHSSFGAASTTNPGSEYDDVIEFVTLDYLQSQFDCSTYTPPSPPATGNINFDNIGTDFAAPTSSSTASGNGVITTTSGATPSVVMLNPAAGTGTEGGCLWYQGTAGTCVVDDSNKGGVCQLGTGFRTYFKYDLSTSPDGGVSFAIPAVKLDGIANNGNNDNLDTICGAYNEEYIGYASTTGSNSIQSPKLGVEFDLKRHAAANDPAAPPTQASNSNHFAVIFWGDASETPTNQDDNRHGAGSSPQNPSNTTPNTTTVPQTDGIFHDTPTKWLETTGEFRMELEVIDRTAGQIQIRAWYNCQTSTFGSCSDLSDDLANFAGTPTTPDIQYSITDTDFATNIGDPFYQHRVGWTFAFTTNNDEMAITDFGLTWR